jgi:beta-glucosidase
MSARTPGLAAALVLSACMSTPGLPGAERDSGGAGRPDAGGGGIPDAGQHDAGSGDDAKRDAGQPDAGSGGGMPDAGQPDAGDGGRTPDAGTCISDPKEFAHPFRNYCLPLEERVTNLLSMLTDAEAVSFLSEYQPAVSRLGIAAFHTFTEGIHGLSVAPNEPTMGITSTQFPQASGLGETWDPEMLRTAGAIEGHEARVYHKKFNGTHASLAVRAPVVDLSRDPRAGRSEEHLGEDPYLVGELAKGFVRGLQGDDPSYLQVASTAKHFLAYSEEDHRDNHNVTVDERNLREYYLLPFRDVLQAGGQAFMTSYNAVGGVPSVVSPLIKSIVIQEWGFDGMVCTDAGAVQAAYSRYHYFPSLEDAAAGTVKAGTSVVLNGDAAAMQRAFSAGKLTRTEVDAALRGNFRMRFRLGEFDPPARVPYSTIDGQSQPWNSAENKAAARLVTQKSIVLLKNSASALPLDRASLRSLAVIGPNANQVISDWYGGKPPYKVTALDGIRAKVGAGVQVQYALDNSNGEAVRIASAADAAIVLVGNHPYCGTTNWASCPSQYDGKEAVDRKAIDLKPEQMSLIQSVFQANRRTIVVLVSSFPQAIGWANDNVPAIVHITHSSQELGNALADVLFGDFNPGGRTTVTWYKALTDLPDKLDYDIRKGRTYMYFKGTPLYPFGHGLSYTTFGYSTLRLSSASLAPADAITASVEVSNTGTRGGDEVVQLYVGYPTGTGPVRPAKRLIGFRRVTLAAGERQTVTFSVSAATLATWDESAKAYRSPAGTVHLAVGGSSADARAGADLTVL